MSRVSLLLCLLALVVAVFADSFPYTHPGSGDFAGTPLFLSFLSIFHIIPLHFLQLFSLYSGYLLYYSGFTVVKPPTKNAVIDINAKEYHAWEMIPEIGVSKVYLALCLFFFRFVAFYSFSTTTAASSPRLRHTGALRLSNSLRSNSPIP